MLLATLSGTSFADFNANGAKDAGEPALAGWTVFLDANHNLSLDAGEASTTTNASGAYAFTVSTGNHLVVQVPKPGWTQTNPPAADLPALDSAAVGAAATDASSPLGKFRTKSAVKGPPAMHRLVYRAAAPNDPLFNTQWIYNTSTSTNYNLLPAWDVATGAGVRIAIVDDGVDVAHADMAAGYDAAYSWDFAGNDAVPNPGNNGDHGTAVAGIAVARANNSTGIAGAAPGSRWSAVRMPNNTSDSTEASAFGWHNNDIDIYNNTSGPDDDGQTLEGPGPLALAAIKNAVATGRNGLGNIFVWSAGNGLAANDNVNYDGYANRREVIAVTAIDPSGAQSTYAEPGAAILVAGYSWKGTGSTGFVPSTDRSGTAGYNTASGSAGDYTPYFSGTSAVAPAVSGIVALMLDANPTLTWRDVQAILGYSTRQNDVAGGGWTTNGAGRKVSHKYGFGALDAAVAVNKALTWTNLGPEVSESSGLITVNDAIPDNTGVARTSPVTLNSLTRIEKVEVTLTATHASRGQLRVVLTSPDGTQSVLAEQHADTGDDYSSWTFSSVRHWDEIAKGTWTLSVTDSVSGTTGTLNSWQLKVYGTALADVHYAQVTSAGQAITNLNFANQPPPSAKGTAAFAFQTAPQRVTITFDKDVAGQMSADDFTLFNDTSQQAVATTFAYTAATRTATFTYAAGVLPDGNYTATLAASGFGQGGGLHLDGNGDNVPGDDLVLTFFQLAGDADRNRSVGLNDLVILSNNYGQASGQTWSTGDFDGNGAVGLNDLVILSNQYGKTLAAPTADLPADEESVFNSAQRIRNE
ncbi:MAG: S8 family serine peptidase [Phycisphaerae bacterium]